MTQYPLITHTKKTWKGMVRHDGNPVPRPEPHGLSDFLVSAPAKIHVRAAPDSPAAAAFQSHPKGGTLPIKTWLRNFFFGCPQLIPLDDFAEKFQAHLKGGTLPVDNQWLRNCLYGCTRDISLDVLKKIILVGQRLDMEEAVSLVMSLVGRETACELAPHLEYMFKKRACIWTSKDIINLSKTLLPLGSTKRSVSIICKKIRGWPLFNHVPIGEDKLTFLTVLKKIRRSGKQKFALEIPNRVYLYAGVEQANDLPVSGSEVIIISKKPFRVLQDWLYYAFTDYGEASILRKEVEALLAESQGKVAVSPDGMIHAEHMQVVLNSLDPLAVAYSFIATQRRLQLKIVSKDGGTTFLKKGEKQNQNDHQTPTSFEMTLFELAQKRGSPDLAAFCAVRPPPSQIGTFIDPKKEQVKAELIEKMKRICLLMKKYVDIHGGGDPSTLVSQYGDQVARGPVDQYNQLCTVLSLACSQYADIQDVPLQRLQEMGEVPGKSRKFLAMDIMEWNEAWKDDAFADGLEPFWSIWLKLKGVDCG